MQINSFHFNLDEWEEEFVAASEQQTIRRSFFSSRLNVCECVSEHNEI